MKEDKLQHHNFVAVTHNSSSPSLICYIYKQAMLSLDREQGFSTCIIMNPAVQVQERQTNAKEMRINNSIELEFMNPPLRLTGISTSENKDTSPKPIAAGRKKKTNSTKNSQSSIAKITVLCLWIIYFNRFECQNPVLSSSKCQMRTSVTLRFYHQIFLQKNVVHFIVECTRLWTQRFARCRAQQNNMENVNHDLLFTISHIIGTSSKITLKILKQIKGNACTTCS